VAGVAGEAPVGGGGDGHVVGESVTLRALVMGPAETVEYRIDDGSWRPMGAQGHALADHVAGVAGEAPVGGGGDEHERPGARPPADRRLACDAGHVVGESVTLRALVMGPAETVEYTSTKGQGRASSLKRQLTTPPSIAAIA
jgi:hypothetical protein